MQLRIFSILFLLFSLITVSTQAATPVCPRYEFLKKEFSFESFNPTSEVIDGIRFPGQSKVLYRGIYEINQQFDLFSTLQAMFRQKDWHVGSPIFYGITQVLRGQWDLDHTLFPSGNLPLKMRDYMEVRKILPDVQTILDCTKGQALDLYTAQVFAADLMNKTFSRMTRAEIESRYFNIKDPYYYNAAQQQYGFGNNAADLVISTSYDLIAALYGNKIIVLQDSRKRAMDLCFYNKKRNNVFYDAWVDNGEINTPGYITAEEVLGFQKRYEDRARTNWAATVSTNAIDIAYYRMEYKNATVVLALDGQKKLCIAKAEDNRYYECNQYYTEMQSKPVPYPVRKDLDQESKAPLMGIITDCASGTTGCPTLDEVQKWYGKNSTRRMSAALITKIEATTVNGKKLNWLGESDAPVEPPKPPPPVPTPTPAPNEEEDDEIAQPEQDSTKLLKVISATYNSDVEVTAGRTNDVLGPASDFLDGKNPPIVFKISTRHLRVPDLKLPRRFEIKWMCSDDRKVYRHIENAPAEGKSFVITCDGVRSGR